MRAEESFVFEARQCGVDGTDRIFATGPLVQLAANFKTVGVLPEARDNEQRRELEST